MVHTCTHTFTSLFLTHTLWNANGKPVSPLTLISTCAVLFYQTPSIAAQNNQSAEEPNPKLANFQRTVTMKVTWLIGQTRKYFDKKTHICTNTSRYPDTKPYLLISVLFCWARRASPGYLASALGYWESFLEH